MNAIDALVDDAIEQYEAGETTSLRDFAIEEGVDLDETKTQKEEAGDRQAAPEPLTGSDQRRPLMT